MVKVINLSLTEYHWVFLYFFSLVWIYGWSNLHYSCTCIDKLVALALTSSRSASVFNLNSSSLNDNSSNWWIEFPSLMTCLKNVVFKSSLYPHNWSYYLFDWVCSDQYAGIEGLQFLLLYTQAPWVTGGAVL